MLKIWNIMLTQTPIILLFINKMNKDNTTGFIIMCIIIFFTVIALHDYNSNTYVSKQKKSHTKVDTLWYDPLEGTFVSEKTQYNLIYEEILRLRLKHPKIVLAQAILESTHFNSKLYQENHNLFGMQVAGSRPTTALNKSGYALYSNWYDSLIDYSFWQIKYASKLSEEEYYQLLSEVYASDKNYVLKIKNIVNNLNKYIKL